MSKRKKGEHEELMEKAEDMLRRGFGMTEISREVDLSEDEILKAKSNIEKKED